MAKDPLASCRDEFPKPVRDLLEKQAGSVCSNPGCQQPTRAASFDRKRSINIGTAAHIHAASPNGPRYDPKMTPEQRAASENGIWCCRNCGTLIDDDQSGFPAEVLLDWKAKGIVAARARLTNPRTLPAVFAPKQPVGTDDAALEGDRARYAAFVNAFPSNTGPINWLRDLNVDGFSFERDGLTRLGPLVYDWTAPESGFTNPAVQAALRTLTKATHAMLSYTSFNTWPVNGKEGLQTVPPEWEDTQPERFRTTVDAIHKHAEAVVEAHRELIETARRELGI